MHAATTLLVDLDGDSATPSANVLTWLRRGAAADSPMWSDGAVGEFDPTRSSGRWRISGIAVRPAWTQGDRGVLEAGSRVVARLRPGSGVRPAHGFCPLS
ncbi:SnoaL-like domain-containing protein [Lentzea xinjiangensis]|uniref:SnoaL-like domain-containing protein n=2 Tax=Lentzea xinjiangensis TaxID=402600 RepID=A0A1H9UZU7_9PSEU|nr:nuclear transport factor 2 family protein [Lentzea xinjiangensis]SES14654.1 SnoaL-like domain-containing protein [Lentzea xinjiangensis]